MRTLIINTHRSIIVVAAFVLKHVSLLIGAHFSYFTLFWVTHTEVERANLILTILTPEDDCSPENNERQSWIAVAFYFEHQSQRRQFDWRRSPIT